MGQTRGEMYALAIVLSVLATVAVGLRFHARLKLKLPLLWDDWLTIPALFFTLILAILMIIAAAIGDLGQHTEIGPEGPVFDEHVTIFSETLFTNQLVQLFAVGLTKLSVLMFYRRIFHGKWFDRISWVLIALVISWMIAFFFGNLFQCLPMSISWYAMGSGPGCVTEVPMYLAQAYSDVVTDAMILALPVPWVWRLKMRLRTKIAVTGVFLLGALTIAASCAKMVIQYFVGSHLAQAPDLTYYLTPIVYWPMIEAGIGLVAACLPTLRPLFKNWSLENLLQSLRSTWTLRSTTRSSTWDHSGYSRDADIESSSNSSSAGFNRSYKPNNSSKLETNIEIVPLEEVRIHGDDGKGILVQKEFDRVEGI